MLGEGLRHGGGPLAFGSLHGRQHRHGPGVHQAMATEAAQASSVAAAAAAAVLCEAPTRPPFYHSPNSAEGDGGLKMGRAPLHTHSTERRPGEGT